MHSRSTDSRKRRWLARLWAAPCSLIGLLLGLLLTPLGTRWAVHQGVLEIALAPRAHKPARRTQTWRFSAITLGHVVLGQSSQALHQLRRHEHAHVVQYERWGVMFFVAYPMSSLLQWAKGKRPYLDNSFEIQAREAEREPPLGP
jgi:hypothetical protein